MSASSVQAINMKISPNFSATIDQSRHSYLTALKISPVIDQTRHSNATVKYSRCWIGTSLQWRLILWNIINKEINVIHIEKTPRISLSCKLVPVHNRE